MASKRKTKIKELTSVDSFDLPVHQTDGITDVNDPPLAPEIPSKPWTKEQILGNPSEYKASFAIPDQALLAWSMTELPRYFRQNGMVIFRDKLPFTMNTQFDVPIWFELVTLPSEVEVLEELHNAWNHVSSKGIKVAN